MAKFKLQNWHVILLIALLGAWLVGYIPGLPAPSWPSGTPSGGPTGGTTTGGTTGQTVRDAATLQLEVINSITGSGVTTATVTADVGQAVNGIFDLLSHADTKTVSANPQAMNTLWPQGSELLIHVDCTGNPTGGLDYYDGWYYVKLAEGNPIYKVTYGMFQQVSAAPHYTYRVGTAGAETTGYTVAYAGGTTPYWNLGKLSIYPRVNASNFDVYITYQGVDCSTVTDGSTWVDTDAEITANITLGSTDELIYLEAYSNVADVGWGMPLLVVTQQGQIQEHKPIIVVSAAMTAIGTQKFLDYGWQKINAGTLYAAVAFYKELSPVYTTKGSKINFKIPIPIDSSGAPSATKYLFKFHLLDIQYGANLAVGSSTTTVPTAYGMVTAYGPGAMIQAKAFTVSSGAGATEALRVHITTP